MIFARLKAVIMTLQKRFPKSIYAVTFSGATLYSKP
jgi:hypothetical protein